MQLDEDSDPCILRVIGLFVVISIVIDGGSPNFNGFVSILAVVITVSRGVRNCVASSVYLVLKQLTLLVLIEHVCGISTGFAEVETEVTAVERDTSPRLDRLGCTPGARTFDKDIPSATTIDGAGDNAGASELTKANKHLFERLLVGGQVQVAYEDLGSDSRLFAIDHLIQNYAKLLALKISGSCYRA